MYGAHVGRVCLDCRRVCLVGLNIHVLRAAAPLPVATLKMIYVLNVHRYVYLLSI